jgi:putative spermidine/putrescine transport system ATP-binding protein
LGELVVVCGNDGAAPAEEGSAVGLDWSPQMVRALPKVVPA